MAVATIIGTIVLHEGYRKIFKRGTRCSRIEGSLQEWFACLMISMVICAQLFS